jgi:hypothetical protein
MEENICVLDFSYSIFPSWRIPSGDIKIDLNLPRPKIRWSRPAYRDDKT